MHDSSFLRMQWFVESFLKFRSSGKVLDVGSQDVNGSYRELFCGGTFEYVGLDMELGDNVDICPKNPYIWHEIADETYDVVISGQAFEHIEFMWVTMAEIARVLKPRGMLCVIAPNRHYMHRYPVDCYRFYSDGMVALARYAGLDPLHASTNLAPAGAPKEWYSSHADCMLVAQKPSAYTGLADLRTYKFTPADLIKLNHGMIPEDRQNYG